MDITHFGPLTPIMFKAPEPTEILVQLITGSRYENWGSFFEVLIFWGLNFEPVSNTQTHIYIQLYNDMYI